VAWEVYKAAVMDVAPTLLHPFHHHVYSTEKFKLEGKIYMLIKKFMKVLMKIDRKYMITELLIISIKFAYYCIALIFKSYYFNFK
jgi:hypothetical protein